VSQTAACHRIRPPEAAGESSPAAARALVTPLDECRTLRSLRACGGQLKDHRLLAFHQVRQEHHVAGRKFQRIRDERWGSSTLTCRKIAALWGMFGVAQRLTSRSTRLRRPKSHHMKTEFANKPLRPPIETDFPS
jgi:hypothetical protein